MWYHWQVFRTRRPHKWKSKVITSSSRWSARLNASKFQLFVSTLINSCSLSLCRLSSLSRTQNQATLFLCSNILTLPIAYNTRSKYLIHSDINAFIIYPSSTFLDTSPTGHCSDPLLILCKATKNYPSFFSNWFLFCQENSSFSSLHKCQHQLLPPRKSFIDSLRQSWLCLSLHPSLNFAETSTISYYWIIL